ncbi:MAG: glutamate synthase-related protein [Armatimonadota bacterium]|nr:glutamate synthase-related protein [Armatimonadota bacterium]
MATTVDRNGIPATAMAGLGLEPPIREVRPAPDRFRNSLGKYRVWRSDACVKCGKCEEICPRGVHVRPDGYPDFLTGLDWRCTAEKCKAAGTYCVDHCPQKALKIELSPMYKSLGDFRWTADLILSAWHMAATGEIPDGELEYEIGNSGGGFDRMRFKFPENGPRTDPAEISTALPLNRRGDNRPEITIDVPVYGGGMSFGSVSPHTMLAKARAATAWNTFSCTGEGGYPERLFAYRDHVITQVATGLFGVREETIKMAPIVEFKYAQGAKPGLGGHLLGDKNTPAVAAMREAVAGTSLFSPFPFHSVYSIEDHKKHVDWVKHINPRALVSAKVSTPVDVDMVAVGSYFAGAHIVHIDGSYGGTGAAPEIAKKNIAMPIEYAIPKVAKFLQDEGIRDKVTLIASGGIRTACDMAKAIALGADGVVIGTPEMVALGCIRCGRCESGRGCARGIATTDPELIMKMTIEWGTQRLINMHAAWRAQLVSILSRFGMRDVKELRGRTDLLTHLDYE